ncbi:transmembrane protein 9B isoform X2 [Nematostella vectensis]|uniref:transmembrane protein 9B isoform X2 n=1 Tax=Nematostella vectensis TaxID=45351 RepID=UPI0013902C70|nr:transmembrane protein 9B isoform X2 [Nematostella vectensis]
MQGVIILFCVFFIPITLAAQGSSYSDVRCKCTCPKELGKNNTKNVFVATVEPEQCTCQHIVKREERFCLRCQCKYEARNTILIKVIIIIILIVLAILCCYCIYLVVDSKLKPVDLSVISDEVQQSLNERSRRTSSFSMRTLDQKHARWKQAVAQQRRHIYDTRTINA